MQTHSSQSRTPESSHQPSPAIKSPGWGKPQRDRTPPISHDFSHVDLFFHAPQRAPVQMKFSVDASKQSSVQPIQAIIPFTHNATIIQAQFDLAAFAKTQSVNYQHLIKAKDENTQIAAWETGLKQLSETKGLEKPIELKQLIVDCKIPYSCFESLKVCLGVLTGDFLYTFMRHNNSPIRTNPQSVLDQIRDWVKLVESQEEFQQTWDAVNKNRIAMTERLTKQHQARETQKAEKAEQAKRAPWLDSLSQKLTPEEMNKAGFFDSITYTLDDLKKIVAAIDQSKGGGKHYMATLEAPLEHRLSLMRATEESGHIQLLKTAVFKKDLASIAAKIAEAETYTYPSWQKDTRKLNRWLAEAETVEPDWDKGTFGTVTNSLIYHFIKHVVVDENLWTTHNTKPKSLKEYSDWAKNIRDQGQRVGSSNKHRFNGGEVQCSSGGQLLTAYIRT